MTTSHPRKSFLLLGAVSVSIAAFAADTSAQSSPRPARPLSDAIAEVLRGSFHGERAPAGLAGAGTLLSWVAHPGGARSRVDQAASWSTGTPDAASPPAEVPSPPDRPFGLTVFAAIGSHIATVAFLRCQHGTYGDPGRFTGPGRPGVIGLPPAQGGSLCSTFNTSEQWVEDGFLLLVPTMTTAGAATLSGRGFMESVGGSALGFLGSLLFYNGMTKVADEKSIADLSFPMWILGGIMHGVTTAYLTR